MKIVVLGAGVVGVTTAYYLARAGHLVTVVDRQPKVAQETSFANAGLIAPAHANSWASPRAPWILAQSLLRRDTSLRFRLRADPALWRWTLKFLANCTTERNRINTLRKLSLCIYSRDALIELRRETNIAYDEITKGALYLYRGARHFAAGQRTLAMLNQYGLGLEAIDTAKWFGFQDDIVVRIKADGSGSRIDIRSKSRVGNSDLGANAQRIREFTQRLKAEP